MKKTVDVAEFIEKIKQANQEMKKNKIKCHFVCKHGYSQEECVCLKKSAM